MNLNIGVKFEARQENGQLIIKDRYRFRKTLAVFGEHALEILIRKQYKPRTRNQEGYYRGAVIPMIAQFTGQNEDVIAGIIEMKFLEVVEDVAPGQTERRIRRTSELNTVEMNNLIERARKWAWDTFEMNIPDPEKRAGQ